MKTSSYWLENIHKITLNEDALPKSVEVAIVGGGYSGVSSVLELARDGVQVVLIDKKWHFLSINATCTPSRASSSAELTPE